MLTNKDFPKEQGQIGGFSLLEVLCALGILALVFSLLFQGLGQGERASRALEQKKDLLAVKKALKRELKHNPALLSENRLLQDGPLFYLSFSQTEPGLKVNKNLTFSQDYTGRDAFVVYAHALDAPSSSLCVRLDLHPLSLRGKVAEAAYSFPLCL